MAYYLAFDGVDDYVEIAPIPVMSNFDIEFQFKTTSTSGVALIGSNTPTRAILVNDHFTIIIRADGIVQVYNGSEQIISATTVNDGITHIVRYSVRNHTGGFSGTSELFIDEVKEGDTKSFRGAALADSNVVFIGRTVSVEGAISGLGLNLKKCVITDFDTATNSRDYNPSSSNGTGSILPDDISGADGTLFGSWPTDDSQWVFYGEAGATYSLTFDPATYAYTGSDLSLLVNRSISFDAGNYSYSGVDLNLSASRNISFDTGSYAYTGNDISLLASRSILLDVGSYAYTGNDLTLTYNPATGATYTLSFDTGSYLYSGNDLGLSLSRKLSLDTGNYSYNGNDKDLLASRKLSFDAGNYLYSGNDLTLTYTPATGATYFISLNAGSYLVSGNTIQLAANRALLLDAGSYELTGAPVTLATNRKLSLDAGSYAVTGGDTDLIAHRSITLESGEYDYLGNPITLTYSGQIISLIDDYSVNYTNDFVTASYANNYINAEFK